jgi:hypothetical protein
MIRKKPARTNPHWIRGARIVIVFMILGGLLSSALFADEPEHIKQSVRALGMGNAFVATASDENALFYNPAGLQSVQRTFFEIIGAGWTTNQNLNDLASADTANTTAAFGDLVGKSLYTEVNLSALSITAPGWGYAFFSNLLFSSVINNPVVPYFDVQGYYQYGAVGGLAWRFMDQTLDIGLSLKSISRNGVTKTVHIVDLLSDSFGEDIERDAVERNQVSPDIGAIYHFDRFPNLATRFACVVRNIGGMEYGSAGSIPMTIDLGVATQSEIAGVDLLFAVDYVDITSRLTEYTSYLRNLKLGAEAGAFMRSNGHHALAVRAGINAGHYLSAGLTFNIPYFPLKIDYAVWSEEIGLVAGEIEDRRQSVQISINF